MVLRNLILVAWDFTPAGENALDHAIRFSLQAGHKIRLLHVMTKGSGVRARNRAEQKIKTTCQEVIDNYQILIDYFIIEGNLFDKVTPYAESNKVSMVIMGTHGIKGFQKWFGSRAMRVIDGSRIPFIVVQKKAKNHSEISDLVYPLNGHPQEIEKISWITFIAKYLNSKVHLIHSEEEQETKDHKTNLNLSLRNLLKNNISYHIYRTPNKKELIAKTLTLAKEVDAELIVWLGNKPPRLSGLFDKAEEKIIANPEKIPVLYLHPDSIVNPD